MTPIPPEQFDREWGFYEECLLKIKALRGGSWQPRHVFADVMHGKAFPYAAPEGFVIFKAERDNHTHERVLLVWMAYGEGMDNLLDKYAPEVLALARENGFDRIDFVRGAKDADTRLGPGKVRKLYSVYSMEV